MGLVDEFLTGNQDNLSTTNTPLNQLKVPEMPNTNGIVNKFVTENYGNIAPQEIEPQRIEEAGDVTTNIDMSQSVDIIEGNEWFNRVMQAWNRTQLSGYQHKKYSAEIGLDDVDTELKNLEELKASNRINIDEYTSKVYELSQKKTEYESDLTSAEDGIKTNEIEINNAPVSKLSQLKEQLANAKGADQTISEIWNYSLPSGLGSQGGLMMSTLAATFGKSAIKKIAGAAVTGAVEGLAGGPAAEITVPLTSAITTATQIGSLLYNAYNETSSEMGDAETQAREALLKRWYDSNNPLGDPNIQPSEDEMKAIRKQAHKGIDQQFWTNMAAITASEAIEMVSASFLFEGVGLLNGVSKLGGYNKYTRLVKAGGVGYLGTMSERLQEGVQAVAQKRQLDTALNLGEYQDKGVISNMLTDGYDSVASINWGLPYQSGLNFGGKYANDAEFQAQAEAGGLLGILGGSVQTGAKIYSDINTYLSVSKDLKDNGIANVDDKVFRLKDGIYQKYLSKDKAEFLIEGIRNLRGTQDEKGLPILSDEQARIEAKNIAEANEKYKEVTKHLENVLPDSGLGFIRSPEQKAMLAVFKNDLFHASMNMVRQKDNIKSVESLENIKNLIQHQENIVEQIKNTKDNAVLEKTYNLKSRLAVAQEKLNLLKERQKELYTSLGIKDEEIPELSVEESNKNKESLIKELDAVQNQQEYNELLKVKSNASLVEWFKNRVKKSKKIKQTLDEHAEENPVVSEDGTGPDGKPPVFGDHSSEDFSDISEEPVEIPKYKVGDTITVNHNGESKEAVITNINKNIGGSIYSIDYEIPADPSRLNNVTTQEEINSRKGNVLAKDLKSPVTRDPSGPVIDENPTVINTQNHTTEEGPSFLDQARNFVMKALSIFKTENGTDDDSKPTRTRFFRYVEKNNLTGFKLLIVTKKTQSALYNEILDAQKDEKDNNNMSPREFEDAFKKANNQEYPGTYLVLTDSKGRIIKVDNQPLFSTMTSMSRALNGDIIATNEELVKLNALDKTVKELNTPNNYLEITGKSKGIAQLLPIVNGERQIINVEEAFRPIDKIELNLVTVENKATPGFGLLRGLRAKIGKLYIFDANGRAYDLIPRKLRNEEIEKITSLLLERIGLSPRTVEKPSDEIEKLIYFGVPTKGADNYTIGVKEGILYLGLEQIPINELQNPETLNKVKAFLANKVVHVNKAYAFNDEFTDIFGITYNTYKDYLLGKNSQLFGTDLRPKTEVQTRQQYLIYNPVITKSDIEADPEADFNPKDDETTGTSTELPRVSIDELFGEPVVKPTPVSTDTKADIERRRELSISEFDESQGEWNTFYYNSNNDTEIIEANSKNELLDKINAKYDAEPAVLEGKPTETKTEQKPQRAKRSTNSRIKLDRLVRAVKGLRPPLSQEEINWFKSVLPNIPVDKIQGLIENSSFGRFLSSGRILLSSEAVEGTLRHEAFHAVTQLYLNKDEITALYNEVRDHLNNPNLTDLQVEEILAEDFVDYAKTGRILNKSPKRNSLFRKLLNAIKDLLGLKANTIEDVYRRLDKGFYSNKDLVNNRQFTQLNKAFKEKSELFTKEILDGIDSMYFDILFENDLTPDIIFQNAKVTPQILEQIYDRFAELEENATDPNLLQAYSYVLDNFDEEIIPKWSERLSSLGFEVSTAEEEKLDSLDSLTSILTDENKGQRQGEAFQEANTVSTKSTMSKSSKLLIRSLPAVNKDGSRKLNSQGLPELVNFNTTYNFLLKELAGVGQSYELMYAKIKELSNEHPELNVLLDRLGEPSGNYSFEKTWFIQQFRQDFDKNQMESYITMMKADGNYYLISSNKQTISDRVKDKWKANTAIIAPQNSEGRQIIDLASLPKIGKFRDNLLFLQSIGITFSEDAIPYLNTDEFEKAVVTLSNRIQADKGDITDLFLSKYDEAGNVNNLLALESLYNKDIPELSTLNAEKKTIYSIGLNSMLSIIKNVINNSNTLAELYDKLPHLNTVTVKNSVYISRLFDKNGNKRVDEKGDPIKLELDLNSGLNSEADENVREKYEKNTADLTAGEKYLQDITNVLMTGKSTFLRPSDKSTDLLVGISNWGKGEKLIIPINSLKNGFNTPTLKRIFLGYFESEVRRIAEFLLNDLGANVDQYNKNAAEFTIFKDFKFAQKNIINEIKALKELSSDQQEEGIKMILNKYADNFYGSQGTGVLGYLTNYQFELDKDLFDKRVPLPTELLQTYSRIELVRAIVANDFINTIEQSKVLFGDPAFYKDLFKRSGGLIGQKQSFSIGNSINSFLNNNNKRLDKKIADDKINTIVFNDVKVQSDYIAEYVDSLVASGLSLEEANSLLNPYFGMEEGDAQGWITLDEYRELAIRLGDNTLWSKAHEQAYEKAQRGEELSPKELVYFKVLKTQYFGPSSDTGNLFVPTYHKYSLMPLMPQLVKGKNLEVMLNNMTKNEIGYSLFKSGSKVGTVLNANGKPNEFYTKGNSGNINTENLVKQTVYYQFLGLQTKTSTPHDTVIFGTQFRKLLESNLFENGKPLNNRVGQLSDEYNSIISNIVDKELAKLVKELGLNSQNYTAENVKTLIDLLKKEAKDRSLPDNIRDAIQQEAATGQLMYKFDTSMAKSKIDSMLMSLVNSRVIKQHLNGDSLVQGASSGFESIGVRKVGSNPVLKFYSRNTTTSITNAAECIVPFSKNYKYLLKKYKTINGINQAIKEGKISEEERTIVSYRIPTQGLNSMDFFVIKEFASETTTAIILPSEIVAKSGGDYDIDKMNVFRPYANIEITRDPQRLRQIATESWDKLNYKFKNLKSLINEDYVRVNEYLDTEEGSILKAVLYGFDLINEESLAKTTLENFKVTEKSFATLSRLVNNKEEYINEFIDKYEDKVNNNRLIEIAKEVLSSKENFNALITPNSTHLLTDVVKDFRYVSYLNDFNTNPKNENKEALSKEEWLKDFEKEAKNIKYSDQFKLTTKVEQFEKFMLAKNMIGIAAVANTSHTVAQKYDWSINKAYGLDENGNVKLVQINFPHHENENGTISLAKTFDTSNKNKISEIISQIINATVDAAKDPFLFDLNMNMETLSTYIYLTRIGVDFENIAYFMKQPIMTEYLKELSIQKSGYLKAYGKSLSAKKVASKILGNYYKILDEQEETIDESQYFATPDILGKYLLAENQTGIDYIKTQIQVLNDYIAYKEQANLLLNVVKATNHDTAGLGSNLGAAILKQNQVKQALQENFVNNVDKTLAKSFIGKMNLHNTVEKLYGQFYNLHNPANPEFKTTILNLLNRINPFKDDDKTKLFTLIENDLINYIVQNYGYMDNQGVSHINSIRAELFKGDNSIAKQILGIKNSNNPLKNNLIINELFPIINSIKGRVENNQDNIKLFSRKLDTFTSNQLTASFRELSQEEPELYKNLVRLGVLQSGLNNSPITYIGLVPYEYYNELVKNAFNTYEKKNGAEELYKFLQLFIRNNSKDRLVYRTAKQLGLFTGVMQYEEGEAFVNNSLGEGMFGKDYSLTNFNPNLSSVGESTLGDLGYEQEAVNVNTPKGNEILNGVFINQNGLTFDEQMELFDYLKPLIETSAAKTNKGANANFMMGLGLRWDYKNNNPNLTPVNIGETLKGFITPYGYYSQDINGRPLGEITPRIKELISKATGVDISNYDGAIINLYTPETFINRHPDQDESKTAENYPVVAVNIGGKGNFSIGDNTNYISSPLKDGAGYVFGFQGNNRQQFHGTTASNINGFLPELNINHERLQRVLPSGSYRITITMRRVMPLTESMPIEPALINQQEPVTITQPSTSVESLNKKNLFTVTPQQGVSDNKAKAKASIATQYIGFGEDIVGRDGKRSTTQIYREQVGALANTGNYSANDVIFVSVPGKRGDAIIAKREQDRTIREAIKALEAGATILVDNKSYTEASTYNTGEQRLLKNLEAKGYQYSEVTVDGQLIGTFKKVTQPSTQPSTEVTEEETETTPTAKLSTFEYNLTPTKLFNPNDLTLRKGSVVKYNGNTYLFWNQNASGKAQLINTDGTKFSGTPNVDQLAVIGGYNTTMYQNTEYIVTDNNNVYSGATGNLVYTGSSNSAIVQKQRIIDAAKSQKKDENAQMAKRNEKNELKNLVMSKIISNFETYQSDLESLGINSAEDLNNLSDEEQESIVEKICNR